MKLKITTAGNSAGVILPKEVLARLRVAEGDEWFESRDTHAAPRVRQ